MKGFLKSYFSYSRRQMRGLLVLVIMILLVLLIPLARNYFKEEETWDHSEFKMAIQKLKMAQLPVIETGETPLQVLTSFDPNNASFEKLRSLGFSDKQANTLIKYRSSGGKFKTKDDLKKIFGIDDLLYQKVEPYITISAPTADSKKEPDKLQFVKSEIRKDESKIKATNSEPTLRIEINRADSTQLILIRGVGATFARRIITYRNFLGGFYQKDQLLEVYGMTPEILENIFPQIEIDTTAIEKINLNTADFKTLNNHPYIEYSDTKKIMKFKELMGSFKSIDELIVNHLIDSSGFKKVRPYLTLN